MSKSGRALHYVLKVADLKKNIEFFRDKLSMKVLRHEVFDEGCEAACNGPYDNKWSKTMIGYGPEDEYFVLELTYNYSVGHYKLGNDLHHLKLTLADELFDKAYKLSEQHQTVHTPLSKFEVASPDGYKFVVAKRETDQPNRSDITEVCLACSDIHRSMTYWTDLLKMSPVQSDLGQEDSSLERKLVYSNTQHHLRLKQIMDPLDRGTAYGRIAFSCPSDELKGIQEAAESANEKILTPYVSLDTPGKATVEVVILADPDGHEICFVGDEGFRQLSQVDPKANELIEKSVAEDQSSEWFAKKGKTKGDAN